MMFAACQAISALVMCVVMWKLMMLEGQQLAAQNMQCRQVHMNVSLQLISSLRRFAGSRLLVLGVDDFHLVPEQAAKLGWPAKEAAKVQEQMTLTAGWLTVTDGSRVALCARLGIAMISVFAGE